MNTTGYVESFHNKLKKVYLKRKVNKRLKPDKYFVQHGMGRPLLPTVRSQYRIFSLTSTDIAVRHQRGLQIADEMITKAIENTGDIRSSSIKKEVYFIVVRLSLVCESDHCFSPDRHPLC